MSSITVKIEEKIDELIDVLDQDADHLKRNLSRLNELRIHVIKQDDKALAGLLEKIRTGTEVYKKHELKRKTIQKELAHALDSDINQITISKLESLLPKEKSELLSQRRITLKSLVMELKKEHVRTSLLLTDCARFNRLLLEKVFDFAKTDTITYNSSGMAKREGDTTFVNLRY
jgi:hypothetical protein